MTRTTGHSEVDLLTVEEAARRLGIGRTKMYDLLSSGDVESINVGRLRRVPPECLDEFIAAQRRNQGPRPAHRNHRSVIAGR